MASLPLYFKPKFFDGAVPAAGYSLYTFESGTTTPKATYTTGVGDVPNANPIILNAAGELDTGFFIHQTEAYTIRLNRTVALGSGVVDTWDGVTADNGALAALAAHIAALATSAGSALVGWIQAGTGAVLRTLQSKARERISVKDFGATGDGTTDDYAAILLGINAVVAAGGGTLHFPKPAVSYAHGTTLPGYDGVRFEGEGAQDRWRSSRKPVTLKYTGNVAAIAVTPAASSGIDSFQIANLHIDGASAGSSAVGLNLDASAASSHIEGILVENSAITNFPVNQVLHTGVVFDVTYRRVNLSNPDRASTSHCAWIKGPSSSQITFDDCWLMQYTDGLWCVVSLNGDVRFIGGTIAPYGTGAGAHGVQATGSLTIYGTHIENYLGTQTAPIGVQYIGSGGAFISPSECALFGTGIKIGDGTSGAARGWTLAGNVGNNNTGVGGYDVVITDGGSRIGTIIEIGFANGSPTILDSRYDTDGASEVIRMEGGSIVGPIVASAAGTAAAPGHSFRTAATRGIYDTGNGIGLASGGVLVGEVQATDLRMTKRFYPATPANVVQTSCAVTAGAGVPSNGDGGDGDLYIRSDGTKAGNTALYHKESGVWVALVTA